MQCEKCKIKRATVFFTELDRTRHALCSFCDAEQRGGVHTSESDTKYAPKSYLYELSYKDDAMYCANDSLDEGLLCSACKTRLGDILNSGRMGCPNCYTSFSGVVQFVGYGNQYYSKHNEKMPRRFRERLDLQSRIVKLGILLSDAVREQKFEDAAKIRDEIKLLEDMKKGA